MNFQELDADILIVDDEPAIRNGCRRVLSACKARVEMAANGSEALGLMRERPFDVAVIDLIMPAFGGMEVLEQMAAADFQAVPIVITAHASLDTAIEAIKRGAFDYLPKPFVPQELVTRVERAIRWLRLTQQARDRLLELNTEKTRLRAIVNSLADGVFVTNVERQVVLSNPAARELLGVAGEPDGPRRLQEFTHAADICTLVERAYYCPPDDQCALTTHIDQDDTMVMARVVPLLGPDGTAVGAATVLRDVTELMSVERAKSQFMRMVAHELKSPLAAVQGFLKVILGGQELSEDKLHEVIQRCSRRVDGMSQMVRDLLEVSQAESLPARQVESLDLAEVIADAAQANEFAAQQAHVEISTAVPTGCPPVLADRDDMLRILANLISNGVKYNRPGGTVVVSVHPQSCCLRIDVTDTGIGIAADDISRLGEEFFRANTPMRKEVVGTGLGLTLVKRLMQVYAGGFEVRSEVGEGSTFSVTLPTSPDETGTSE